jgi:CheY-like chemotaxis protein
MSEIRPIHVLLVEDAPETVRLVEMTLTRADVASFTVSSVSTGAGAVQALRDRRDIDLVLMDYHLPDQDGLATAAQLLHQGCRAAIIFLTVHRDMQLVREVMKLGVREFLTKEEIDGHFFPQTLTAIHERNVLARELEELEFRRNRLEAMQEMVVGITKEISEPLAAMREVVRTLEGRPLDEKAVKYLGLMRENLERIEGKMEKLKNLREDKTVQYIKDIRMIDLS